MLLIDVHRLWHAGCLAIFLCLKGKGNEAFCHFVELCLFKLSFLDGVEYFVIIDAAASRHFKVKPGLHTLYPVINSPPVCHHNPLKAPLISQNFCQKMLALG